MDEINEKLANAPDWSYATGIVIGSLLPFVVLVTISYLIFSYLKHKRKEKN